MNRYNDLYDLWIEEKGGQIYYFTSFINGEGNIEETEVEKNIYNLILGFNRQLRNMKRSDERNLENSVLSDNSLYERVLNRPKTLEETVSDNFQIDLLYKGIDTLPEVQKKRFLLHYEQMLTYEQIAELEGCTISPIKRSIDRAKIKIKSFFKI